MVCFHGYLVPSVVPAKEASRVKELCTPSRQVTTRPVASLQRCTPNLQLSKLNIPGACDGRGGGRLIISVGKYVVFA